MLLNGSLTYPKKAKHAAYTDIHTFLTDPVWSPDSEHLTFMEEIFGWEYADPYNSDFEGWVTSKHFYLAIVSRSGEAAGYELRGPFHDVQVQWEGPDTIVVGGERFDLHANPPRAIR